MLKIYQNQNGQIEVSNEGQIVVPKIVKDDKGEWIVLPENQYNRKCVSMAKVIKNGGELIIDQIKEKHECGEKSPEIKATKSKWEQYLTDEEKSIINEIKMKAIKRAEKARLIAQIEEMTKQLNEMAE